MENICIAVLSESMRLCICTRGIAFNLVLKLEMILIKLLKKLSKKPTII